MKPKYAVGKKVRWIGSQKRNYIATITEAVWMPSLKCYDYWIDPSPGFSISEDELTAYRERKKPELNFIGEKS